MSQILVQYLLTCFQGQVEQTFFDDLMTYDVLNGQWNTLEAKGSSRPSARSGHAAVLIQTPKPMSQGSHKRLADEAFGMLIFGGWDGENVNNDIFILEMVRSHEQKVDEIEAEWRSLETNGAPPSPRACSCCVVLHHPNKVSLKNY